MNCYVCKNKSKETSYHPFPKEPEIRMKWLEAFGFNETDINNSMKICGDHFEDTCFVDIQDNELNIRTILLMGSVPSVQLNYQYSRRKPDAAHSTSVFKVDNGVCVPLFNLRDSIDIQNMSDQNIEINEACSDADGSLSEDENYAQISDNLNCIQTRPVNENSEPKKKQTRWRPAYVSQVNLDHGFDNPILAKRHFQIAKDRIAFLEKKAKTLSRKVRRLETKSEKQKTEIKFLKEESLVSKQIKTNAEASTSDTLREVISRQLQHKTKSFSPKLLEFAMNLHFCSPKAYKYVRTHLENVLPHETTIAKSYLIIDGKPRNIKKKAKGEVLNEFEDEIADNKMHIEDHENCDSSLDENDIGEIIEEEPIT